MDIRLRIRYLILLMSLVLASCMQDQPDYQPIESPFKGLLLSSLESRKVKSSSELYEKMEEVIDKLDFYDVRKYALAGGQELFTVGVGELSGVKGGTRRAVFQMSNGALIDFRIVAFEGETGIDPDELIIKFIGNDAHDFTGRASVYSLYQDILFFNEYQDGQVKVNGRVTLGSTEKGGRTSICIAWYLVTTTYYSDGTTSETWDYLYTTCDCQETRIGRSLCGGGGGGGGGSAPPPNTGIPSNPQPGEQTTVNLADGTVKVLQYNCYDWGCAWQTVMVTLPAVVVTAQRNTYYFLPPAPFPNYFVIGPDGLLYTYNANWNEWTGTVSAVDPCVIAKALEQNQALRGKMSELDSKTNLDYETGYTVKNNADGTSTYTPVNGAPGQASINISVNSPIDGYIHTHYAGLLSIFSPDDIRSIAQVLNSGNMVNPSSFMAGVVTASGTSYALVIDDIDKFRAFANNFLNDDANFNMFSHVYGSVYNISPTNSVTQNEKSFLQMLSTAKSGLKLLKADGTWGDWDVLEVDTNNNVSASECF